MTPVSQWITERQAAAQAARQAGQLLLDRLGKATVTMKGHNDPVTEVDHAAQALIQKFLYQRFPGDGFVGEEGHDSPMNRSARRWIVDPIDGTINFIHGFPFFCISIGLEAEGRLVVGVIYDPIRSELFEASLGAGAMCNGVPLYVSRTPRMEDALVSIGFPADLNKVPGVFATYERLSRSSRSVRRLGSTALALAYTAAGRLDGFWSPCVNCWDVAAGAVLVAEAGGRVANLDRFPYDPYVPEILATNGLIHHEFAHRVSQSPAHPLH